MWGKLVRAHHTGGIFVYRNKTMYMFIQCMYIHTIYNLYSGLGLWPACILVFGALIKP